MNHKSPQNLIKSLSFDQLLTNIKTIYNVVDLKKYTEEVVQVLIPKSLSNIITSTFDYLES